MDYSFPIPRVALKTRFQPIFSRLSKSHNATLLALPYTGRSSHLRFISSNPRFQNELGINPKKHRIIWAEVDRTDYSYSQFLAELASGLNPEARLPLDDYLLIRFITQQVTEITQHTHLIFIISLGWKQLSALADIDRFIAILSKSAAKYPLNILWSIDTSVFRETLLLHPSSTLFEKIFYFPTFTPSETRHSLTRLFLAKGLKPDPKFISHSQSLTGGISGYFHSLINLGPGFINHPSTESTTSLLISETSNSQELVSQLASPEARAILSATHPKHVSFGNLILSRTPSAQEIRLLNLFQSKINSPITRDELAETIWGKRATVDYSDWAIDKALSRLRKIITSSNYRLITIKNLGYQLISMS